MPYTDTHGGQHATPSIHEGVAEAEPNIPIYDPLTHLKNGQWLRERLPTILHEEAGNVGLVFFDADDLSEINNTRGHEAGNQLLKTVASTLESVVRSNDPTSEGFGHRAADVVRHAGDEFIVILRGVKTQQNIDLVTERALNALAESGVNVSAGGVLYDSVESLEEFLTRGSGAMQSIKEQHKLEKYPSPAQRAAAQTIGAIAAEHNLTLRDIPTLLKALGKQSVRPLE